MNKDSVISFLIKKYPSQTEKKFIERFIKADAETHKSNWWIYLIIAVAVILFFVFMFKKN
jgi:divalent metal cation (Fe/Co/Zn/Cd) transporter